MLIRALLFTLLATAMSPVWAAGKPSQELVSRTKTLGVLVLAGQQLDLFRIGALVFGNKRVAVQAPDTALSDLVFDAVKAQIDQEGALTVRRVELAPGDAERLRPMALQAGPKFWGGYQMDALLPALAPYRAQCGCEALLVVAPSRREARPNSNLIYEGLAWVAQGGFMGDEVGRTEPMAALQLLLVDAGSGKLVEGVGNRSDMGQYIGYESPPVAKEHWPLAMTGVTPEQWTMIWRPMARVLWSTLRRPLFSLGLKPSCTLYFFEMHQPRHAGRDDASAPEPPTMPAGVDPARCTPLHPPLQPQRVADTPQSPS